MMVYILCFFAVWHHALLYTNNDNPDQSIAVLNQAHEIEEHSQDSSNEAIIINQSTHLVFRRYYFIARLEKTITLLKEIMNTSSQQTMHRITRSITMPRFSHALLAESAHRIQQSKTLKPILVVWEDFSAYKSLEAEIVVGKDDLFVKEFSQQLFFITKNIIAITKPHTYRSIPCDDNNILCGSTEYIFESLDLLVDLAYMDDGIDMNRLKHRAPHQDIKMHASTNEINLRFYYLQRLTPIMQIIGKHTTNKNIPSHRAHQESIDSEWAQMTQYRKIGDKEYVQNFCVLLFKVLKGIACHKPSDGNLSFLEQMDIEEILYSMDVIADELSNISTSYNEQDDEEKLSLREWIVKKWWISMQAAGTALLKILNFHYNGER